MMTFSFLKNLVKLDFLKDFKITHVHHFEMDRNAAAVSVSIISIGVVLSMLSYLRNKHATNQLQQCEQNINNINRQFENLIQVIEKNERKKENAIDPEIERVISQLTSRGISINLALDFISSLGLDQVRNIIQQRIQLELSGLVGCNYNENNKNWFNDLVLGCKMLEQLTISENENEFLLDDTVTKKFIDNRYAIDYRETSTSAKATVNCNSTTPNLYPLEGEERSPSVSEIRGRLEADEYLHKYTSELPR